MLKQTLRPHRTHIKAGLVESTQKVFAMLKLMPEAEVAKSRPPVCLALVIDTSGSMAEFADQSRAREEIDRKNLSRTQHISDNAERPSFDLPLPTKLDLAIQACHAVIDDDRLAKDDKITVIQFDDSATTLHPLGPLDQKQVPHAAVDELRKFHGGTQMAAGMARALQELEGLPREVAKRVIVFTDGETFDEPDCKTIAARFATENAPLIGIGVGDSYNETLLLQLAETTRGRPYHLERMDQLRIFLEEEIGSSVKEVVTDLTAAIRTVRGVTLDSCTRVYPSLSDIAVNAPPLKLGNVSAGDFSVFLLELSVAGVARPQSRARLAQIQLAGYAPGLKRQLEMPAQDLFLNFTDDDRAVSIIDPEVMGYVQQKNLDSMVRDAMGQVTKNVDQARRTLQVAVGMTRQVGNAGMTRMLDNAIDELNRSGTISPGTRKTVVLGGRTKTVKTGAADALGVDLTDEEIRKRSGT